jgi:hypothetical protein
MQERASFDEGTLIAERARLMESARESERAERASHRERTID